MTNRYTAKRVPASAYVAYPLRCRYAVEAVRSITAPWVAQVIELELMLLEK
jgi:hypothetical protein